VDLALEDWHRLFFQMENNSALGLRSDEPGNVTGYDTTKNCN